MAGSASSWVKVQRGPLVGQRVFVPKAVRATLTQAEVEAQLEQGQVPATRNTQPQEPGSPPPATPSVVPPSPETTNVASPSPADPRAQIMGYSFFKAADEAPTLTVSEARAIGESAEGWQKYEQVFRETYLPRFDLEDDVEWTIGLWGGPEPSFNAHILGAHERVRALAAAWGKDFDQEAVALLLPRAGASGGYLRWDLGRAVSDEVLDQLLAGVNYVNERLAQQRAAEYGLDQLVVGLTVKESRYVEFWVGSTVVANAGQALINDAFRRADVTPIAYEARQGYDFVLLMQGNDY